MGLKQLVLLLLLLLPLPAIAQPTRIAIRAGNHPDFGRLVFDVPPGTHYRLSRDGNRVIMQFDPALSVGQAPGLPRNMRALTADPQATVVQITPGATTHDMRLGDHVVLDVFDPAESAKPESKAQSARPKPRTPRPSSGSAAASRTAADTSEATAATSATAPRQHAGRPATGTASTPSQLVAMQAKPRPGTDAPNPADSAPTPARSEATVTGPNPAISSAIAPPAAPANITVAREQASAPAPPPGSWRADLPSQPQSPVAEKPASSVDSLGLLATLVPAPNGMQGSAFTLPFPTGVGAAAFRRQDIDYVVFDQPRPLDLTPLRRDKLLWSASVHLLPAATLIRLRLPSGMTIRLFPAPQGWTVAAVADAPPPSPIGERVTDGRLLLAAAAPGQVITLADPETGATLLIGTQREPGQAVAIRRRGPEFTLQPSWQGVPVEALSERLSLRVTRDGFALGAEPGTLSVSPLDGEALADAAALTRRFRFADLPPEMLRQRIARGLEQAAAAPPLSRGPLRQAVARDMIALGLAAEAQSLLHVAMQEDPKEAASADAAALAAIAALLADRPEDAGAITDPRLPGSDEVTFWRAVLLATRDDASPQAAASFAVTAPLALVYPPAMRDKLLPKVVDTMLRGAQAAAAQALLARCGQQPGLEMAHAMADEAAGKVDGALQAYDAQAHSADQRASARAAVRALELRLKLGRISLQQLADGLDRQLYAWRGDRHDLSVRERLAALRQQSGAWRAAFATLRGAEQDFPEHREEIRARLQESFAALLRGGAVDRLPPLDLVALVDENADLLPASADGEALQAHLADRLLALDLPDRAEPVLQKLMGIAPTAAARAGFGARLAALRLHEGDAAGALQALLSSAASGLRADLAQRRLLLFATATARRGDVSAALGALADLHSAPAAGARAEILEQAQDWWGADRALTEYVARIVPATGSLDDAQRRALLRLATAAARAGDEATLAGLNARESARMGSGALGDMFHLLTAPPVRGSSDLSRARREAALARALPVNLKALEPVATH